MTRPIEYAPVSEQDEDNSFALFALAWRRKWIVLLLVAIGLGLGYLFYVKQTPVYQSTARVHIVRDTTNGPIEDLKISSSYDTVHETLIRSQIVLEKAIELLDIPSLPTLAPSWMTYDHVEDPERREELETQRNLSIASQMMGRLQVEVGHKFSGDVLVMTYRSEAAEECPKVLMAVHAAYQDYQKEIYAGKGEDTEKLIEALSNNTGKDLAVAESAYADFRHNASELLWTGDETENVHATRAKEIEGHRRRLEIETLDIEAQVKNIEEALGRGVRRDVLNLMVDNPGAAELVPAEVDDTLDIEMLPKELELHHLRRKFGQDFPKVQKIEEEIRLTRERLLDRTPPPEKEHDFLDDYLEAQREQIKLNRARIAVYDKQFIVEEAEAKRLSDTQIKGKNLQNTVDRLRRAYNVALDQAQQLEVIRGRTSTTVRLIDRPGAAYQVDPDLTTVLIAAGLLGMLAGIGLAFAIDRADRRFQSPDEIRTDLGIPVVGHIPVLPGIKPGRKSKDDGELTPGELSRALRSFHHPRGRIAEAYRAVRTALYFSTRGSGHQVIQVTSPSPGDGKSTLSGNLAISIANSGKHCLLIDADFRRPRIHKLFGLDNSQGISSVIEGKTEVADAVQQTDVENLSIMSCGPRPDNPSELLSSKRFAELLEVLREQYDLVVVDTPPVLAVTDPLNVVARVDGVLLVLRLTKSARTMGRRALEALDGMGANVLGIVINGVGSEKSGYGYGYSYGKYGYAYGKSGYGGYRYGYGSDYAYQYHYGEGYGDDQIYYEDEPASNGKSGKVVPKLK